jgi:NAD(P)-dependent dehydrogenase (short-subunit alcohol dehydrogenase family)
MAHFFARHKSARVAILDSDVKALRLFEERLTRPSSSSSSPLPPLDQSKLLFLECDVSSETSVRNAVRATLEKFGGIDGLVSNAGIANPYGLGYKTRLEHWSTDEFERYLSVNLTGTFLCARECAEALEKTKGAIVNISSCRARQSEPLSEGVRLFPALITAHSFFALTLRVRRLPKKKVRC